jgi:hypothetical protein
VEQFHEEGNIIVFDDSKTHLAFNRAARATEHDDDDDGEVAANESSRGTPSVDSSPEDREKTDRIVLIIDIMRPPHLPLGSARGGHTPALDSVISLFR